MNNGNNDNLVLGFREEGVMVLGEREELRKGEGLGEREASENAN